MKKMLIMVMAAAMSSMAYAQGDALKSILKAKTYEEAQSLLNSNLTTLTSEQKAKAYNKLVDLAMSKVSKEEATISTNQMKVQLKQGDPEAYDTVGYYKAVYDAVYNGVECDKYDNMPNAKGKVSPKFHANNQKRLQQVRLNLINGGQYAAEKGNHKEALKNYSMYVESSSASLYADGEAAKAPDQWLGEVARVAAVYSVQNGDNASANKYCDVALNDTASHKDALALKMYILSNNLKTHEDSIAALKDMEEFYEKEKDEQVFNSLVNMYGGLGQDEKQLEFINQRAAIDPDNYMVWALKGQNEMNAGKWDEATVDLKKAISLNAKNPLLYTYLGYVCNSKAGNLTSAAEQKALYTESVSYLEKARELDPNRQETNWSYPLYQCYYNLYGPDDSRTKELEAMVR